MLTTVDFRALAADCLNKAKDFAKANDLEQAFNMTATALEFYCKEKNVRDSEAARIMVDRPIKDCLNQLHWIYSEAKKVKHDDGQVRLDDIKPIKTDVRFDDIAGLENVKQEIRRALIDFEKYEGRLPTFEKRPGGLVLYGPPGCGKSMMGKALANEIDADFYYITCSDWLSMWYGQSSALVKETYKIARSSKKKSIVFIDEFEELGAERSSGIHEATRKIVAQLLTELDGNKYDNSKVYTMGATNRLKAVDKAIRRAGRLKEIYIPLPDEDARIALLQKLLDKKKYNIGDIDIAAIAKNTEKKVVGNEMYLYTGADLFELVRQASWCAVERDSLNPKITEQDFDKALELYTPSLSEQDLASYKPKTASIKIF